MNSNLETNHKRADYMMGVAIVVCFALGVSIVGFLANMHSIDYSLAKAKSCRHTIEATLDRMNDEADRLLANATNADTDLLKLGENFRYLEDLVEAAWSKHATIASELHWPSCSSDVAVRLQAQELRRFANESRIELNKLDAKLEVIRAQIATRLSGT